jgi:hypothetical protein
MSAFGHKGTLRAKHLLRWLFNSSFFCRMRYAELSGKGAGMFQVHRQDRFIASLRLGATFGSARRSFQRMAKRTAAKFSTFFIAAPSLSRSRPGRQWLEDLLSAITT